jgi:superfamily II DNA/RNA helicase
MLDMGFIPDVEKICALLKPDRQTLLFSATMPPPIKKLADRFMHDPRTVEVARPATANIDIAQRLVLTDGRAKRDRLVELLREDEVRNAIIFCNRKTTVRDLASQLKRQRLKVGQIHGDMEQPERIRELDRFKDGEILVLVASDVAARGLDIKGVSHVFNFDVPWHPDDYIHRIGRTGRAGQKGIAITLATPEDAEAIAAIEKLTGLSIPRDGAIAPSAPASTQDRNDEEKPRGSRRPGSGRAAADERRPEAPPAGGDEPERARDDQDNAGEPQRAPRRRAAGPREQGRARRQDERSDERRSERPKERPGEKRGGGRERSDRPDADGGPAAPGFAGEEVPGFLNVSARR